MNVVVTGGCGFVGHHLIEHLLKNTDWNISIFDKLSYAAQGYDRLRDIEVYPENQTRVRLFSVDLAQPISEGVNREVGEVDYILHLAAESHVDNSIDHPVPFIMNNVQATLNMLEYARLHPELKMFVNFSTDEVFGPAPEGYAFKEIEYHYPSNPYSASKSAQEKIGIAYSNTYKVPVITTHTMNVFGERQHPEKFVPMVIRACIEGREVFIHANEDKTKAGTRFYIHGRNLADALLHVINQGYNGYDEWNIAGLEEVDNLTLANLIREYVTEYYVEHGWSEEDINPTFTMVDFHSARPGHDLRYALDSGKLLDSGYQYPKDFRDSLRTTVRWTLEHQEWM